MSCNNFNIIKTYINILNLKHLKFNLNFIIYIKSNNNNNKFIIHNNSLIMKI